MNAKISAKHKLSNAQRAVVNEYVDNAIREQTAQIIRRYSKMTCLELNRLYGFGAKRIYRLLIAIGDTVQEHDYDEVFWAHVDKIVIDELKIPLERETGE